MILYIIKSALCMGICWILYRGFMADKNTFLFNRAFLLLGLIGSTIIPFISISVSPLLTTPVLPLFDQYLVSSTLLNDEVGLGKQIHTENIGLPITSIVYWAYIFICILLSIRFIRILSKMVFNTQRKFKDSDGGMRIIVVDEEATPYSFFNNLFINNHEYKSGLPKAIFYHELCHAKQFHSLDRLLSEIMLIVQWWNPLAHLLYKDLKENHEYTADLYSLDRNGEKEQYVHTLIRQSIPKKQHRLLQLGFADSSLLNRLKMIHSNKVSSNPILQLLLIVALLFTLFSCSDQPDADLSFDDSNIEISVVPGLYGLSEYSYPTQVVQKAEQLGFGMTTLGMAEYKSPSETLFTTFVNAKNYRFKIDGQLVDSETLSNYSRLDIKGYRVLETSNDASINEDFSADLYTQEGYFKMVDNYFMQVQKIADKYGIKAPPLKVKGVQESVESRTNVVLKRPSIEYFMSLTNPNKYIVSIDGQVIKNKDLLNRQPEEFSYYTELNHEVYLWTNSKFEKFKNNLQSKKD